MEQNRFNESSLTIANLVGNGDIAAAVALRQGLEKELEAGLETGLYTDQFVSRAKNQMDRNYYGSLLMQDAREFLIAGDTEKVMEMINALEMNQSFAIPDEDSPLRQDDVNQIRDPATKRAIAADIRRLANGFSDYLSGLADQKFVQDLVTNLQNGNNVFDGQKYKNAFGEFWKTIGISQDRNGWLSDQAVALVQDQNGIPYKAIVNGNILPAALEDLLDGIASGNVANLSEKELQNALTIYQTVTQGVGMSGDLARHKGLSGEATAFFDNLDIWTNTFGLDSILRGGGIYAGAAGSDRTQAIEDGVTTKLDGRNARQAITNHLREEDILDGLPAGAVERLMVIAKPAYAFLSVKDADRVLKNSIDAIYFKTDLIGMPGRIESGAEVERAEFAPERFYNDAMSFGTFTAFTIDKIRNSTGKTGILGEDFFLFPSTQSTNRHIRWFVIDAKATICPTHQMVASL